MGIGRSPYKSLVKTGEDGDLCGEEAALLSKRLATIKTDIPLEYELEDFSTELYEEERLRSWCEKLNIQIKSVFGK